MRRGCSRQTRGSREGEILGEHSEQFHMQCMLPRDAHKFFLRLRRKKTRGLPVSSSATTFLPTNPHPPFPSTCPPRCKPTSLSLHTRYQHELISSFSCSLALGPPLGSLKAFVDKQRSLQTKHNFTLCVCVGDFFGAGTSETDTEVDDLLAGRLDGEFASPSREAGELSEGGGEGKEERELTFRSLLASPASSPHYLHHGRRTSSSRASPAAS